MPVIKTNSTIDPAYCSIQLEVVVAGMVITVPAGTFKSGGVEYALAEDQAVTFAAEPLYDRGVIGFLVVHKDTGAVSTLVDEIVADGAHQAYDWSMSAYRPLERLYRINIPRASVDLAGVDLLLTWTVAPSSRQGE